MRKLLLCVAMLGCSPAFAQPYWTQKPVQCGSAQEMIDITLRFGEAPYIKLEGTTMNTTGALTKSKIVVAYNDKTETWTLLEFTSADTGCILNTGRGLEHIKIEKGMPL